MAHILKDRKLTLHGAHVCHIGSPVILLLASAYASDRISRKVFIETLNTLVRREGTGPTDARRLQQHHLVRLGISETDAKKIPLIGRISDCWTVAGILSGVTDVLDFELLYDAEKKGDFFKRHFEKGCAEFADSTSRRPFPKWNPYHMLLDTPDTYRSRNFQSQIKPACDYLERGPQWYDPAMHVRLRLAAAGLKDHHLNIIGPFASLEDMDETFADIFHVVEPHYKPVPFGDYESFTFEEPANPPPKAARRKADVSKVTDRFDDKAVDDSTADNLNQEQAQLIRDIQQVTKDMLKRAGINHQVEIPAERIAAQFGAGVAEGKRRDANASRPPSCVIV
nr:hypothetical protein [Cupriavidus gilardii]